MGKEFYEEDELDTYDDELNKKKVYVNYYEDSQVITMSDLFEELYRVQVNIKYSLITLELLGNEYVYAIKEKTYLHDFVRVLLKDLHLIL